MNPHETKTLWKAIQSRLSLDPDGVPGPATAVAVAKAIGIRPEIARDRPAPTDAFPVPASPASAPEFADNPAAKLPPPEPSAPEFDERSERLLGTLLEKVRPTFRRLLRIAKLRAIDFGCDVRIISGTRTFAEQDALYAKGRTAPGPKVTNAKGGQSNHNFGIAVDLGIFQGGSYLDETDSAKATRVHRAIAEAVKAAGLPIEWGGDWKSFPDIPHHQHKTGLSMAEMRERIVMGQAIV